MTRIIFSIILINTAFVLTGQDVFTVGDLEMTFEFTSIDLGKVKKGESREFDYKFKNTGKVPIRIDIVSGCDCTTADWPREEINPGEEAVIPIVFDSTEKEQSETVEVDIYLLNENPKTGGPILKIIDYTFELVI